MSSILVVEDTESLRDVLCAVLSAEGHQVKEAASAEEALKLIETDDFSLVLSDVKLPSMNGLELLQSAKAMKSEIPFVMMTAYGSIQTAVDAMKIGATDFITKPFDPQGLCDLLKGIIEHKRIIPGKPDSLSKAQRAFVSQSPKIELLLKHAKKVAPLSSTVLIDCPPSLGLLSLNGLVAASRVIVPVQSEFLALHGVRQLLDTIDQVRSTYNPALAVGGVLICLHDSRRRLDRSVADTIREYFGDLVFKTVIRTNVALAEAPARGTSILRYDAKSPGAEDYTRLADEILEANNGKEAN